MEDLENADLLARKVKAALVSPTGLIIDFTNVRLSAANANVGKINNIGPSGPGGVATTVGLPGQVVIDYQLYATLLLAGAKHG